MGGSAHLAIVAASAVIVTKPQSMSELVISTSIGALGGLIADIDTSKSKISTTIRVILISGIMTVLLPMKLPGIFSDAVLWVIKNYIAPYSNNVNMLAIMAFLILLVIGSFTKHRKFTHSIEYTLLVTSTVYFINLKFVVPLLVGLLSHMLLDLLNYKDIRISVLLRIDVSLDLCKSNGVVNWCITAFGGVIYGMAIYWIR